MSRSLSDVEGTASNDRIEVADALHYLPRPQQQGKLAEAEATERESAGDAEETVGKNMQRWPMR